MEHFVNVTNSFLWPNARLSGAVFPFIGQVLPHGDAPQPFANPLLGVALLLVEVLHPGHGRLGVFDLVNPLLADPGQPALERLDFERENGLDDPEQGLGAGAVRRIELAVAGLHSLFLWEILHTVYSLEV